MVSEIKLKAILPHTPHKFKVYTSNDFRKIVYNKDTLSIYGLIFLIPACVLPFTKTREFYHKLIPGDYCFVMYKNCVVLVYAEFSKVEYFVHVKRTKITRFRYDNEK